MDETHRIKAHIEQRHATKLLARDGLTVRREWTYHVVRWATPPYRAVAVVGDAWDATWYARRRHTANADANMGPSGIVYQHPPTRHELALVREHTREHVGAVRLNFEPLETMYREAAVAAKSDDPLHAAIGRAFMRPTKGNDNAE